MSALAASEEFRREVQDQEPHGVAFVAEDPDGRIVGEAYAAALGEGSAEVAFVVADGWQHHGVGTLLRAALFEQLRADRIVMVFAELLPENRAMMEADSLRCRARRDRFRKRSHRRVDCFTPPSDGGGNLFLP
jgi:GNAT superfamily N-acetyltransferase